MKTINLIRCSDYVFMPSAITLDCTVLITLGSRQITYYIKIITTLSEIIGV